MRRTNNDEGVAPSMERYSNNPIVAYLRNLLVIGALVALFLTFVGRPYLRLTYEYRGYGDRKVIMSATYWSFEKRFETQSGSFPLIVILPPERTLADRLRTLVNDLTEHLQPE